MRYLCIALCQKKEELKLNKLSKISGLSRWEAKATKHKLGVRNGWGSGVAANRWVPHPTPSVYCEALRPPGVTRLRWNGTEGVCQDSLLPWGISLELVPPAVVAVLQSLGAVAASPVSAQAVLGSASSETGAGSCCKPPQLALFSPMWPSMVWDRRVSQKRAHSANSGSATYVIKPEGGERAADAD